MKTRFIPKLATVLLALSYFMNTSQAQEIIPFKLTSHNNIIVHAFVNDKDSLDLMFQIAMQEGSISPQRVRKAESIIFANEVSKNNTVKIGNITRDHITFYDNELAGPGADGKIGTGFFEGQIYQIDYDKNQFVVYNKLPNIEKYEKINIKTTKYGQLYLPCTSIINDIPYTDTFLLQSGYAGGLLYSNGFTDANELNGKLEIIGEKTLRNSQNQSITTLQGILPKLEIKDIILKNVTAGFFIGDIKNQSVSYFGADLIKRFNWIIDKENLVAYIQPSKHFNDPYFEMK